MATKMWPRASRVLTNRISRALDFRLLPVGSRLRACIQPGLDLRFLKSQSVPDGVSTEESSNKNQMNYNLTIRDSRCNGRITQFRGPGARPRESRTKSSSLSVKDKTFMRKAAKGGMMEVA